MAKYKPGMFISTPFGRMRIRTAGYIPCNKCALSEKNAERGRMRRIVILIMFALVCNMITTNAQNIVRKGNVFIEQSDSTKRSHAQKTKYTYQDKNGDKYTIYVSKNGKYFIIKKSKKSGKEYRKYLKDIKF